MSSFAIYGDELYVGGAFSDTQIPSTQGKLSGVAIYHINLNSWGAPGSGVDSLVAATFPTANSKLLVPSLSLCRRRASFLPRVAWLSGSPRADSRPIAAILYVETCRLLVMVPLTAKDSLSF